MKYKLVITLTIFLLAGCAFHSEPEGNREFHQIAALSELAGVYRNQGNPSGFLSSMIWPDINPIRPEGKEIINGNTGHESIEFIEVIPKNNSLLVKAIRNGCAIYDKTYTLDHDFKISAGKIILHRETHLLGRGADDVLVGPSYEEITLGLDTAKHGKSTSSGYAAGLVLMLFPLAVSETTEIRYERVSAEPLEFKNCPRG